MTAHPAGPADDQLMTALRELCQWIEEIATGWQEPEELVRLLDLSGQVLFMAEDYRLAARSWMRALEITRAHADELPRATDTRVSILDSLSRLYHHTQRPLKAIDLERELVSLHQEADQTLVTIHDYANALARLGATLVATDQFVAGREYLVRADQAFQSLDARTPGLARIHARVLALLATVHRHQQEPAEADRCEARAVERTALPLVPVTHVIYELNSTITTACEQLATLAQQVAEVVDAVGDRHQPQATGLAQVPGTVATWYELTSTVADLGFRLVGQVRALALAADDEIGGPRQPTLLDKLAEFGEWTAYIVRKRGEAAQLIEVYDRTARVFYQAEDFRRAQTQWQRALETADQLACTSDPTTATTTRTTATRILENRSDLAHARNRLNDAIDVETELLNRHRYDDHQPATARALARLGATMITAKHYGCAEDYLTEAAATFQAFDSSDPDTAKSHADTLELLATVLNHQGRNAEAARRRQQAEALRTPTPHPAR